LFVFNLIDRLTDDINLAYVVVACAVHMTSVADEIVL